MKKSKSQPEYVIPPSKIDFEALVKQHGHAKARQLLRTSNIEQHQHDVKQAETDRHQALHKQRAYETLKLSQTAGRASALSIAQKIVAANTSVEALERALEGGSVAGLAGLAKVIKAHEKQKLEERPPHARHEFIEDHKSQYALRSTKWELLVPNNGLHGFPTGMCENLALQTAYIRRINASRNEFVRLTNAEHPQLSVYHFRYLVSLNLSFNKITRLPDNFGELSSLEVLILSNNRISKLPRSFNGLTSLRTLDLSGNSFSYLPEEFGGMMNLADVDLSNNLFSSFPYPLIKLESLKILKISRNAISHLAILPPHLKWKDMFVPIIDEVYGRQIFMNILTRERVRHIELFTTKRIDRAADLHTFQREGTLSYRRRKMWLSVCGIHEWEPASDPQSGKIYYKNNVSGQTSWHLPPSLDSLGLMEVLTELTLRDNPISYLPPSFSRMKQLVKLVMVRNRLKDLPEDIGNMKHLEILDISSNELKLLPVSICDCTALKILHLDDNHLVRLPENLGFLPNLKSFSVNSNRLTALPFSLGYCKTLRTLSCNENMITDPPMMEFTKGLDTVLWYLRNRFMIDKHGKPPLMEYHEIGIAHEVTILKPEFEETITQKMIGAQKDGILNLQLLGLREIPVQILAMKNLRRLKLDFNDYLDVSRGFPPELHRLQALSFRACRLPVLPDNIHVFDRLTNLNLEENRLEWLPDSFCELLALTTLNLSKNHIYRLPDAFHHLTALQTLILESNYLEELCDHFEAFTQLKVLHLGKNRLGEVPDEVCHLENLRVLNLEKNKLTLLPRYINRMALVDLRVGHNKLESLAEDLFQFELGDSVRMFSCVENNLLELPTTIRLLDATCTLEADYNPLISPPQYLLSDGLLVLKNYMAIRAARRKLLYELMVDEDFDLSESSFSPVACEVLEDGTGFLTPDDLAAFDQAVQEYMNGEFFKCPATGEEIVARVTKLRDDRETEMYLRIIYAFLDTLNEIVLVQKDPRFPESSICEIQRPWGRNGEMMNCWAISLVTLLRETGPNMYYPEGRPSVFNMIAQRLPPMAFPFTVDLLKDSIRLYISPYGPVADTEQVTFPACDCVDDIRGKPKRHDPCQKAAVVLAKSVYIDEEADRREEEEDEFLERFETVEDDVRIWLVTDEGRKCLEKEVKKRKAILREELSLREEMLMAQQMKHKKKNEELKGLQGRLSLFLQAAPYEQHGFYTKEEATMAIDKVQDEIAKFHNRIGILTTIVADLKAKLSVDWKTACVNAALDLVQKYCVLAYNEAVTAFRQKALDNGWKRHWDGEDGKAFAEWKRHHVVKKRATDGDDDDDDDAADHTDTSGRGGLQRTTSTNSVRSDTSGGSTNTNASSRRRNKNGELEPEFNWDETSKMEKYNLPVYTRYRQVNGFSFMPK
eukprot:gene6153-4417_t